MTDRDLALAARQALLMFVDALERWLSTKGWWDGMRTSDLRKEAKRQP